MDKNKEQEDQLNKEKAEYRLKVSKLEQTIEYLSKGSSTQSAALKRLETSKTRLTEKETLLERLEEIAKEATEATSAQVLQTLSSISQICA